MRSIVFEFHSRGRLLTEQVPLLVFVPKDGAVLCSVKSDNLCIYLVCYNILYTPTYIAIALHNSDIGIGAKNVVDHS